MDGLKPTSCDSPGPGKYSPKSVYKKRENQGTVVGKENRMGLRGYLDNRSFTPGPGNYELPERDDGVKNAFGKSNRSNFQFLEHENGPGQYEWDKYEKNKAYSWGFGKQNRKGHHNKVFFEIF